MEVKYMKFKNLDDIDQDILNLLSQNSRMSYIEIGKKVNLSRVAVKSRIQAMEKKGIIEQYSIIVNPQKVGRMVSAFFDIEVQPSHLYEVASLLSEKDYITDIYQMTGSSKLHVHAIMELNKDLERFLKDDLYKMPGIVNVQCNLIISRIKTRKGIRL
jgi:Lrp/AsnC family leucine-responsive transcriptional regulator